MPKHMHTPNGSKGSHLVGDLTEMPNKETGPRSSSFLVIYVRGQGLIPATTAGRGLRRAPACSATPRAWATPWRHVATQCRPWPGAHGGRDPRDWSPA